MFWKNQGRKEYDAHIVCLLPSLDRFDVRAAIQTSMLNFLYSSASSRRHTFFSVGKAITGNAFNKRKHSRDEDKSQIDFLAPISHNVFNGSYAKSGTLCQDRARNNRKGRSIANPIEVTSGGLEPVVVGHCDMGERIATSVLSTALAKNFPV